MRPAEPSRMPSSLGRGKRGGRRGREGRGEDLQVAVVDRIDMGLRVVADFGRGGFERGEGFEPGA